MRVCLLDLNQYGRGDENFGDLKLSSLVDQSGYWEKNFKLNQLEVMWQHDCNEHDKKEAM